MKSKAQQAGSIQQDSPFASNNLDKVDEDAIRECIWSLIIQGIVVPGISTDPHGSNLPWLQVTEWGKVCLEKGDYVTYDAFLFLNRLRSEIPGLDSVVELYLKEALNSFRSGTYVGAAVMIGVASERTLVMLRDAIRIAIKEADRRKKLMNATEGRPAKRIYEEVRKRIDPLREQLPPPLQDSIDIELDGIFQMIRRTRNDAGHPTGIVIERSEANALLQLFPVYARSAYALMAWLKDAGIQIGGWPTLSNPTWSNVVTLNCRSTLLEIAEKFDDILQATPMCSTVGPPAFLVRCVDGPVTWGDRSLRRAIQWKHKHVNIVSLGLEGLVFIPARSGGRVYVP